MNRRQVEGEAVRRELLRGQSVALLRELHLVGRDGALHADSLRKLKQVKNELLLARRVHREHRPSRLRLRGGPAPTSPARV